MHRLVKSLFQLLQSAALFSLLLTCAALAPVDLPAEALKINPENSKYFVYRGKPLVLLSASEHYGSVINRPFDFEKYLTDAAEHKMTMTRTFLLFRELQSARNPSSPCKPESPDYIAPYLRAGPGKALDGEPTYDLDRWNPEYFERLHRFLQVASDKGIVVELTLFSNTYAENIWALNPLRDENNLQHVGRVEWEEYTTLKEPELVRRQLEYARKILEATASFDNVYYEICNEPGGGVAGHASPAEVDAWQKTIAETVRSEMARLKSPHLIAGQQAFTYSPKFLFPQDGSFANPIFDIVNNHPLPDTQFNNRPYQLGHFMSKELMLSELAQFCRAAYSEKKPLVLDEDNTASMYRDFTGWTIHRKRAWTALLNGSHYDYIDFSLTVHSEAGTPDSRRQIRSWMQHLSEFMQSFDYVHSLPSVNWVKNVPEPLVASGLSAANRDFVLYVADAREAGNPDAGHPIAASVTLTLPPGEYTLNLYSPVSGQYSPGIKLEGGGEKILPLPAFEHDIVVRATRN